jgi:hypothetical protein
MKIIRNKVIPFKGFMAVNLFGVLFVRGNAEINEVVINHESIHTAQMKELGYVPFYLLYFIEWVVRLFVNGIQAYRNISFEKEAYGNQANMEYLRSRQHYSFLEFI